VFFFLLIAFAHCVLWPCMLVCFLMC